jgi:hypothetical protein
VIIVGTDVIVSLIVANEEYGPAAADTGKTTSGFVRPIH